ncbi:MAG: hypothetical protein KA257_02780 [Opitutaceae bacterium]|nr:hypothetical protein [Opitutaceae bacterium]
MLRPGSNQRGSVVLVALCFVAVLGIALVGYITVSNQAMRLSNRSSMNGMSGQFAEMGLEQSLLAFNTNDWSSWTLSGTTATRTLSFASTKYGSSGVTGTIKLRVDNYNAFNLPSNWSSATSYNVNDLVNYSGTWYRCLGPNSNKTPSSATVYWIPEQVAINSEWSMKTNYADENLVVDGGRWYRCQSPHLSSISNRPPNPNWIYVPNLYENNTYSGINESILNYTNKAWYRYSYGWDTTPPISWRWRYSPPQTYAVGDSVFYNKVWYVCKTAHTSSSSFDSSKWTSGTVATTTAGASATWTWSAANAYKLNDVVYRSGSWYRCILAHTGQQPPNATYWSTAPLFSYDWRAKNTYAANSIVNYGGVWYRNTSSTTNQPPVSPWSSAATSSWSSATAYSINAYVSYGGVWYRCVAANTGKSPNNATYWTALGAPVIYAEGTATRADGTTTKTQLRALIAPAPLFPNAAAATDILTLSAGGTIDSYDSGFGSSGSDSYTYNQTTTPFSVGSPNIGYVAVLAGGNTSGTAVTVTTATVMGYVAAPSSASSPYAPLTSFGGSAIVKGSAATPSPKADVSRLSRNPYIPQFDTQNVWDGALLPDPTTWSGSSLVIGTPGAVTPAHYYYDDNLDLNGDTLTIVGPVVLDIQGQLRTRGRNGRIVITPTGSAEIHFSGRLRIQKATGSGIDNQTLDPKKLILIGSNSGTNHLYQTTAFDFYGVIYLPNAGLTIDNGPQFYGALSAKTLTFSDDANLHYDTSLRSATFSGVDSAYIISQWAEITNQKELVPF